MWGYRSKPYGTTLTGKRGISERWGHHVVEKLIFVTGHIVSQAMIRHDSSLRKGRERRHAMIKSVSAQKPYPPAARSVTTRRNYSKGADLLFMEKAIYDWTKKEGGYLNISGDMS